MEQGEKLFPNTAAEGRDIIRQEIRCVAQNLLLFTDHGSRTMSSAADLENKPGCNVYFVFLTRSLREKWEGFSDDLSDTQRELEVSALQWSSYDESVSSFQKWISEAEAKLKLDSDLKATLQEKKVQLHSHKVLFSFRLISLRSNLKVDQDGR